MCIKDDTTPETPAGPTYLSVLTGEWKVTRWYGYEYEVINNTIHENSWNLVFDSLDGPIKYNEDIYGKMSHLNWDMDCGFNVIDDNEIEIIAISNLYFNIYRCKRIQK